jgi:hypothetical protein
LKNILKSLLFLLPFYSLTASAVVLVNAPSPAPQHLSGDSGYGINFAAGDGGTIPGGAFFNADQGYRVIDTGNVGSLIYLDVSSNKTFTITGNQRVVVTLSVAATAGDEIPLTGASAPDGTNAPALCNSSGPVNCQQGLRNSQTYNFSAFYSPGAVMRVSFSLRDLCATPGVTTGTSAICASSSTVTSVITPITISQTIYASFSVIDVSNINTIGLVTGDIDSLNVTLGLTSVPPTIACPSSTKIEDFYFPGDSSVLINADGYPNSVGVNGVTLQSLVLFASQSSTPVISSNGPPAGIEVGDYLNFTGDRQVADGFINTTNGTDHGYHGALYEMNSAGIFSTTACTTDTFPTGQGDSSSDGLLRAQAIQSVLTESKCFIATAAFHDGKAAPVMMLRKFRDQILSKFSFGRDFISTYYTYSPALAEWAWDKPFVRAVALHALAPVEFMAWAILKLTHAEQVQSTQPYIDKIKKKLDEEDTHHQVGDSYIETERKKLSPTPTPGESYIDRIKKTLPNETPESGSYTEKLKQTIPDETDPDSPIAKVKEGRDHLPTPHYPPITTGVSFMFGVNPGVKVVNPKGTVRFADMYGGDWQPDLQIRFEHQLFHSENFGSFGLDAGLGVGYAEGYGQYQFGFGSTNSKQSRTKFSFLQLPTTVGGVYRFNLLRILRPYAGASVGSMNYAEIRSDAGQDKRGYSLIYEARGGVSLLMDFLDKKTATEGYLSNGVQHSYLYAEYLLMKTLGSTSVDFERSGVYLGFLLEY